jgi:hypothetical protein
MTPIRRTRALAASLAVLASLVPAARVPAARAQDAKPGAPSAPSAAGAKPDQSPADIYAARRPEVMAQIGLKLEAVATFAWNSDLKKTALSLYKRIQTDYDPNNKKSNEQLGYEKKDGVWVPPGEAKQKKIDALDDSARGEKLHLGEFDKKLKDAETASGRLLADLGDMAKRADRDDEARELWKQALDMDDQNSIANERMGNKLVDGKWFTQRALAYKEFAKVYKASLVKAQGMGVAPVGCDDSTGIAESAKIPIRKYKTKNFRIESNFNDADIRETLVWLERARQFYIDLFVVPERLVDFAVDPEVFVIVNTKELHEKLIDACGAIPPERKNFEKKFTSNTVSDKLTLTFYPNAEMAERSAIHTATHCFTKSTFGQPAPWLMEALANAVSAAIKKADLTVCFGGDGSTGGIHLDNISLDQAPGVLRDLVKAKKDAPMAEFVKLPADGMSAQHIAKSWSVVMYLLELDRTQARDYFNAAGAGMGDASKDEKVLKQFFADFGTWKDLDVSWREWALDVYKQ